MASDSTISIEVNTAIAEENARLRIKIAHQSERMGATNHATGTPLSLAVKRANTLAAALGSSIRELERINSVKDGQPLVSHGLLSNLRAIVANAEMSGANRKKDNV